MYLLYSMCCKMHVGNIFWRSLGSATYLEFCLQCRTELAQVRRFIPLESSITPEGWEGLDF